MDFMHGWNKGGVPNSICLPFIFFTQGFLTGALQKHARKHLIPVRHETRGARFLEKCVNVV